MFAEVGFENLSPKRLRGVAAFLAKASAHESRVNTKEKQWRVAKAYCQKDRKDKKKTQRYERHGFAYFVGGFRAGKISAVKPRYGQKIKKSYAEIWCRKNKKIVFFAPRKK